ncbi:MAG: large conductance mechanosensitive channel protein MscL [Gemmatimonadales bacterium]
MAMLHEFKEFAVRGNVMDLAVGVIIGAAFGKIVDSVVNDLVMPLVGRAFGGFAFSNYFLPLKAVPPGTAHSLEAMKAAGIPVFAYGNFLAVSLNFLILAFIIFEMVKAMNRLRRNPPPPAAPAPSPPSEEVVLLREIRDAVRR